MLKTKESRYTKYMHLMYGKENLMNTFKKEIRQLMSLKYESKMNFHFHERKFHVETKILFWFVNFKS